MCEQAPSLRFQNLLNESRYAFNAGDFRRAELILAEAKEIATRQKEMEGAE